VAAPQRACAYQRAGMRERAYVSRAGAGLAKRTPGHARPTPVSARRGPDGHDYFHDYRAHAEPCTRRRPSFCSGRAGVKISGLRIMTPDTMQERGAGPRRSRAPVSMRALSARHVPRPIARRCSPSDACRIAHADSASGVVRRALISFSVTHKTN
jgi:hypothetical protein